MTAYFLVGWAAFLIMFIWSTLRTRKPMECLIALLLMFVVWPLPFLVCCYQGGRDLYDYLHREKERCDHP